MPDNFIPLSAADAAQVFNADATTTDGLVALRKRMGITRDFYPSVEERAPAAGGRASSESPAGSRRPTNSARLSDLATTPWCTGARSVASVSSSSRSRR